MFLCSAASAWVAQPPLRACTTTTRALRMLEGESEAEWSPLDQWLEKGVGTENTKAGSAATLEARAPWTVESAGHIHSHFFGRGSFEKLGVSQPLCESLAACGYTQPSTAQQTSFEVQAKGEDVVLAQPSGSGKTLAYLVPLLQRLAEAEAENGKTPPGARPARSWGKARGKPRGTHTRTGPCARRSPLRPSPPLTRLAPPGQARCERSSSCRPRTWRSRCSPRPHPAPLAPTVPCPPPLTTPHQAARNRPRPLAAAEACARTAGGAAGEAGRRPDAAARGGVHV